MNRAHYSSINGSYGSSRYDLRQVNLLSADSSSSNIIILDDLVPPIKKNQEDPTGPDLTTPDLTSPTTPDLTTPDLTSPDLTSPTGPDSATPDSATPDLTSPTGPDLTVKYLVYTDNSASNSVNILADTPEELKILSTFSETKTSLKTGNSNAKISVRIDSKDTPEVDVHQYEKSFEYKLDIPSYQEEMKMRAFQFIKNKLSPEAAEMVQDIMVQDIMDHRSVSNIDGIIGYRADDLLFHLLLHGCGEDLLNNLDEQLADCYRLGRCPQGRTVRLLSLINAFCL